MSEFYNKILDNNRKWVADKTLNDPDYFKRLSEGQSPPLLWIGCSDSRVPANEITGTQPGEVFVHRNIANMVIHSDMNLLSVLDYAVNVLKVRHVIVCGHYGCGGVEAAYTGTTLNMVENWTMNIRDIAMEYKKELDAIPDLTERLNKLSELNVIRQLRQLCKTSVMHDAFRKNEYPKLHGWVLDISHGLIKELPIPIEEWKDYGLLPTSYEP